MNVKTWLNAAVAGAALVAGAGQARALEEITVGYFLEWPMPFQFAKVMGTYEEEMGVRINWVSFDVGTAMSAAMASGDVQLSVSQGVPPFVIATSAGQDLVALDVAVSYAENDNCVVASALEIDQDTVGELAGKTVAVPLGTAAHYGFLRQMDHFGVDLASLNIVDMAPPDGAAAIANGQVDMACGWGGSLRRMKEFGDVLLTGPEKEALGILVFDVTSAPASFAAEYPDLVATFLRVTAEANAAWNDGSGVDDMLPVIAMDAGMDVDAVAETMASFVFPDVQTQLSDAWLGGAAPSFMKGVADVFVATGSIPSSLDDYTGTLNLAPLTSASDM